MTRLMVAAKSRWSPSIRREHAICALAGERGIAVDFYESPADVRSIPRSGAAHWLRAFPSSPARCDAGGVEAHRRSTFVPGHRHRLAAAADNLLLRTSLRKRVDRVGAEHTVVVVNVPWQWPATAGLGVRRVFDAADDWTALLGGERRHVRAAYARIAREADSVIVANRSLTGLFPERVVHVVENGMPANLITESVARRPEVNRLVYAGTLSDRFDVSLMDAVLRLLPDWTLDLYGQCHYPGYGDRPAKELLHLLEDHHGRARWHGVVERGRLGQVLDSADVALVPNVAEHSRGQSSMKFGDYAARGCPIVSTRWEPQLPASAPPATWFASTPPEFAAAVRLANGASPGIRASNVAWARARTWDRQWPKWATAAFASAAPC